MLEKFMLGFVGFMAFYYSFRLIHSWIAKSASAKQIHINIIVASISWAVLISTIVFYQPIN